MDHPVGGCNAQMNGGERPPRPRHSRPTTRRSSFAAARHAVPIGPSASTGHSTAGARFAPATSRRDLYWPPNVDTGQPPPRDKDHRPETPPVEGPRRPKWRPRQPTLATATRCSRSLKRGKALARPGASLKHAANRGFAKERML